jgi:hypothetical protein
MKKENIIICHGHLYLFWSAGVYYTRELAEIYNIVLYVPEYYRKDDRFIKVCGAMNISEIVYFNNKIGNPLLQQAHYCQTARKTVEKYRPVSVVQHDYISHENMYLFHWVKAICPNAGRVVILTSWASGENTKNNLLVFRDMRAREFAKKYFIPKSFLLLAGKIIKNFNSFIVNKLIPGILLRRRSYYPLSEHSNIDILPLEPLFDYFLVYNEAELKYQCKLFGTTEPFKMVQSPVADRFNMNEIIYNIQERDLVTIFPSLIGIYDFETEKEVLEKWVIGLNEIKAQLPDYQFTMKIHPDYDINYTRKLTGFIGQQCPFMSFVNSGINAEELMLESQLIVGDVSSTLWWSNFIETKTVISLDMKNYPGSGDMRRYGGIIYVDDCNKIKNIDLNKLLNERRYFVKAKESDLPYLTEFVQLSANTKTHPVANRTTRTANNLSKSDA